MSRGEHIIGFIASDELRRFDVRGITLNQVISGGRAGVSFLGVSGRLAEAFFHNVPSGVVLVSDRELGARRVPDNLNLLPPIEIPYPKQFWGDSEPREREAVFPFLQRSHSVNNTWQWGRLENRLDHTLKIGMLGVRFSFQLSDLVAEFHDQDWSCIFVGPGS